MVTYLHFSVQCSQRWAVFIWKKLLEKSWSHFSFSHVKGLRGKKEASETKTMGSAHRRNYHEKADTEKLFKIGAPDQPAQRSETDS